MISKFCKFSAFSFELQKFFSNTRTFFLTVGQNNFGNKIPFLVTSAHKNQSRLDEQAVLWNVDWFLRDDMTRLVNLTLPVCVVCLELLKVLIPRHALMNKRELFCFIFLAKSWLDQKLLPLIFVFENVSRLDSPRANLEKKSQPFRTTIPLSFVFFHHICATTQENLYLFLFFS